jgi:hypothetical protein
VVDRVGEGEGGGGLGGGDGESASHASNTFASLQFPSTFDAAVFSHCCTLY